jgi:hypothetical protein
MNMLIDNFYPVGLDVVRQTISESKLANPIDMGSFTVYHGTRFGAPIVIAEHRDQKAGELSGIWYATELGVGK